MTTPMQACDLCGEQHTSIIRAALCCDQAAYAGTD